MTSGAKAQTGAKSSSTTSVTMGGDVTGNSATSTVAKINGSPLGTTTGATTGYVLTWNGSSWVPAATGSTTSVTMGGDVTGNSATSTVAKLQGNAISVTAPTTNQVLQWNGTSWIPTTLSSTGVTSFNTRTGAVVPANADYLAVASGGLTGATNATRYVGGTANGAPISGTFAVGDFIVDATSSIWVCVTAGTPGTWATTISNHITLRSATATAKYNEITLFTGSTASQTISAPASPIDSVTWSIINNSSVNVTLGFSSNAMYVLGSNTSVTSYTVTPASAYSFVNYNGGNWYMTSTNDLTNGTGIIPIANGGTGSSTANGALTNLGALPSIETVAGKNFLINGGLDFWQRGTSFTNPSGYTADRWIGSRDSGQNNSTYSQQTSGGITGLPYYMRVQRTSGDTQTGSIYLNQSIETNNSYPMANQNVTLSFWARAGANYSATSNSFTVRVLYGATNNIQMYHYTSGVSNSTTSVTLTTSWQQFTYTVSIPSTSTQVGVEFQAFPTGTAGANDYFDFAGCQLEISNSVTTFSRAGGSIGNELILCQRYFQTNYPIGSSPGSTGGGMWTMIENAETNRVLMPSQFPVQMRIGPTMTAYSPQTGTINKFYNRSTATDITVNTFTALSVGFQFNVVTPSQGSGNQILVNYTANAEL